MFHTHTFYIYIVDCILCGIVLYRIQIESMWNTIIFLSFFLFFFFFFLFFLFSKCLGKPYLDLLKEDFFARWKRDVLFAIERFLDCEWLKNEFDFWWQRQREKKLRSMPFVCFLISPRFFPFRFLFFFSRISTFFGIRDFFFRVIPECRLHGVLNFDSLTFSTN